MGLDGSIPPWIVVLDFTIPPPPKVFHVPMEERRFNSDEPSFGNESRQSEIIRDINQRTGCDVEISQAKDHSLSIMVTGKPSSVLAARKAVLSKLQTQVRRVVEGGGGWMKVVSTPL